MSKSSSYSSASKNWAMTNADMRVAEVRQFCELDEAGQTLIKTAMSQLQLSARAYHRVLKLARTIADLAGDEEIKPPQLAEALQYRPKGIMIKKRRLFRFIPCLIHPPMINSALL